jgi:hypothetical protein
MGDAADALLDWLWRDRDYRDDIPEHATVKVEYKAKTEKAILVAKNNNEYWIPRSLLSWDTEQEILKAKRGTRMRIEVEKWFQFNKGERHENVDKSKRLSETFKEKEHHIRK